MVTSDFELFSLRGFDCNIPQNHHSHAERRSNQTRPSPEEFRKYKLLSSSRRRLWFLRFFFVQLNRNQPINYVDLHTSQTNGPAAAATTMMIIIVIIIIITIIFLTIARRRWKWNDGRLRLSALAGRIEMHFFFFVLFFLVFSLSRLFAVRQYLQNFPVLVRSARTRVLGHLLKNYYNIILCLICRDDCRALHK